MGLLDDLGDGQKREITENDYDYFLGVLPPALMRFRWGKDQWDFGFAEGYDYVYAFKKQGDQFFAQKTDILNPREEPNPTNRTSPSLIVKWLEIGKKNEWIRRADDPPFNTGSFHRCQSDEELLDTFTNGRWCVNGSPSSRSKRSTVSRSAESFTTRDETLPKRYSIVSVPPALTAAGASIIEADATTCVPGDSQRHFEIH